MRRAGTITRIAGGVLVVRTDDTDPPSIGADTVDDQLTPVGPIVDVFGPVDNPYLAVSPTTDRRPTELLGETLYLRDDG